MTGNKKSSRAAAMSRAMKLVKNANPGMAQTQVMSIASKQLSTQNKGRDLSLAPNRAGSGMYLRPNR